MDDRMDGQDYAELAKGKARVRALMSDGGWHSSLEIQMVAGEDGIPASEGLRRMRELRTEGYTIEKRIRAGAKRVFEYRMLPALVHQKGEFLVSDQQIEKYMRQCARDKAFDQESLF